MSDYASAPAQPILQGLVTVVTQEVGLPLVFFYGRGCSAVTADITGVILTLDKGLPGDVALDTPFARTVVTMRGLLTTVVNKNVEYPDFTHVKVLFTDAGADTVYQTFEIIVWRGDAGVEPANVNIVGGAPAVIFT